MFYAAAAMLFFGAFCMRYRLVLGGVAPKPWRVSESVEEDVSSGGLSEDDVATLAERAMYDANPLANNGYKVELAKTLLRRGIARIVENS